MLFRRIHERDEIEFQAFVKISASELGLAEKDLEDWMSRHPKLLFGGEEVLVIAQSVSGLNMADILALDVEGRLVIVEIKRDWSNRETVGQLLEYAADKTQSGYEDLEKLYRQYWTRNHGEEQYVPLLDRFRELTDDQTVEKKHIPKRPRGHRICIVAPASDDGLARIIDWLREYGVPIGFIPFSLYTDGDNDTGEILLEIKHPPKPQAAGVRDDGEWQGDWFFNTNETHAPGAYFKMFDQGVIAIYGYPNGPTNLEGSTAGQRVFAYVNVKGILACGRIVDGSVVQGHTVFEEDKEFHVKVQWDTIVADDQGIRNAEIRRKFDRSLPVRNPFCCLYQSQIADWIADELQRRKNER